MNPEHVLVTENKKVPKGKETHTHTHTMMEVCQGDISAYERAPIGQSWATELI